LAREYGLDKYRLRSMIEEKLQKQPDLFYYIEDPYIEQVTDLILDCVIEVVENNNKQYSRDLLDEIYRLR
jgi:hypothetical protein